MQANHAGATVVAMVDARGGGAEAQDWSAFAGASAQSSAAGEAALQAFCGSWLALTARHVPRARQALLLLAEHAGQPYRALAVWPDPQRDVRELAPLAEQALRERCGLAVDLAGSAPQAGVPARLAFPIEADGRAGAVVVLEVSDGGPAAVQGGLRALHWASGWLLAHLQGRHRVGLQQTLTHSQLLNELSALALQQESLRASALAVANEIAARYGCSRVSVGFERRGSVRPLVMSHKAHFDARSDAVQALGGVMDEALDLGRPLRSANVPVATEPDAAAQDAGAWVQAGALGRLEVQALAAVPLGMGASTLGVMTLERVRGPAFSDQEMTSLDQLATWIAPVWSLQQAQERSLAEVVRDRARAAWPGWRRPGRLLVGGLATLALLAAVLVPLPHRVSARASLEGSSQRAVLVPFDGYLAETWVQAGDTVKAGQALARLEDRELRLEVARWQAEHEQLQRRVQAAMAAGDRTAQVVGQAQVAQSEAMLALASDRLHKATLVAPHDAVVVSGDWRQHVGAAVERGRTLFELAPPDGHRVVLMVDDVDMAFIAAGQRGELVLASLADRSWPFAVTRVTPVAAPLDGRNVFRVEARLEDRDPRLRPGMEGVGKVHVGERSALWVWTHGLWDWLRLATWSWVP